MSQIPRVRQLGRLSVLAAPSRTLAPVAFIVARSLTTTTSALSSKNTEWVRGKLWKGEAPGPADPYTQRIEAEPISNLPNEAREVPRLIAAAPQQLENSRLVLPPRRTEAATEKAVQADDPSYTPALSMDELEEIAPASSWWDQPGHWGAESVFRGFGDPAKVQEKEVIEVCLRRAFVEVLALQQSDKFSEWVVRKWGSGGREALDSALSAQITITDGKASLKGDGSAIVSSLMVDDASSAVTMAVSAQEAREMAKSWDSSWKDTRLDRDVKFAIRKRLYQLTGNLIPDAKLAAAQTLKHLQTLAVVPPKKPKLAELLSSMEEFNELPNVRLHQRKITSIDRENEVGRWKVIKEELEKRGLPVSGRDEHPGATEKQWMRGWR